MDSETPIEPNETEILLQQVEGLKRPGKKKKKQAQLISIDNSKAESNASEYEEEIDFQNEAQIKAY